MITNQDANTIVLADTLQARCPLLFAGLITLFEECSTPVRILPGTNDIWCRDYFPIQVAPEQFVYYKYDPDYLNEDQNLITRITEGYGDESLNIHLPLTLDGGNVERGPDYVLMTEKVFAENSNLPRAEVIRLLESAFGKVYFFPCEPEDPIGHIDGMIRVVDRTVFVTDYADNPPFARKFKAALNAFTKAERLRSVVKLPYEPAKDVWSAVGNYTNFLVWKDCIVLPEYGTPTDQVVQTLFEKALPEFRSFALRAEALATEGGVLNCITANRLNLAVLQK